MCEYVVREVEAHLEQLLDVPDGGDALKVPDGVRSSLLAEFRGTTVSVEIYVQPGLDDQFWTQPLLRLID